MPSALPPLPDWSNEKVLQFLELYEMERGIWDPTDKNHKLKHKVHDAWYRISNIMDTSVEELRAKKKSLMATFRPLLKKKKTSIHSGSGSEDIFQPIWFAFEVMERFLGKMYDVEETINTVDGDLYTEDEQIEIQQVIDMPTPSPSQPVTLSSQPVTLSSQPVTLSSQPVPSPLPAHTRPNKIRKTGNIDETEIKISQTLDTINHLLKDKRNNDEDDCDIYAKLLAKRLRKYPEPMRSRIMYQIDGLLSQNPAQLPPNLRNSVSSLSQYSDCQYHISTFSTPSPVRASTPSPVHIIPQTQQSQRFVYVMQPRASESPVQINIPESNEILTHPSTDFIPQTSQSQYVNVMQQSLPESSVQPRPVILETNITPQNQMNMIEKAYWDAQM